MPEAPQSNNESLTDLLQDVPIEEGADKVAPETEEPKDEEIKLEGADETKEEEKVEEEEELELITPFNKRDLEKDFPGVLKKYPYIEQALARDKQFTDVFGTVEDAKETKEVAEQFNQFQSDIFNGNISTVLKAVKESDPGTFDKLVNNYISALNDVDPQAYYHILGSFGKSTIQAMWHQAQQIGSQELQQAALLLNQFLFQSTNFTPSQPYGKPRNNEQETELSKREQEFESRVYQTHFQDLSTQINNQITSTIARHIDPKGVMTPYVKKQAINEALDDLNKRMLDNEQLVSHVEKLWERAKGARYSPNELKKIRSTYLGAAQNHLRTVILKARNEALKGMGKRVKEESDEETSPKRGPVPSGRPASVKSNTDKKEIPKGMSARDFIMAD